MTTVPPVAGSSSDVVSRAAWLEVWQHRFAGVCDEVGGALRRAAYSPNIKEREDFSCALFSPTGELVAQAEHIPVHLGSMAASVTAALAAFPELAPGDQVVVNDPFRGGTHLNDITFVAAVHGEAGEVLGFVANRAHHADVGGSTPGSLSSAAVDAIAEGLTIPPVRAVRGGEWDADLRRMILANTRTPAEREGDLDAQWGANRLANRRLRELAGRFGATELSTAMAAVCDHGERRFQAALPPPSGPFVFEDVLESVDGDLVPVRVSVTCEADGLVADFTGTAAARYGIPSAVEAVTRACFELAARRMLDPDLPQNGGVSRRLHLVVPSGSVVAASFPTPVGAGNVEASQRIVDVLLGAMAQLVPEQAAGADQGTMNNLLIGGADGDGRPFVYYETIAGGQGGRPSGPGQSGIHTGMTNTANTPIEALEAGFPLRVLRYGLVEGSGGVGAQPGGDGIERAVQVLTPTIVSLLGERRQVPPWGIDGGQPGACGDDVVLRADGRHEPVGAKAVLHLAPGDTIVVRTPGGGGRGPAPPPPP